MKNFLITLLMFTVVHLIQGQTRPYPTPTKRIVGSRQFKETFNSTGKKDTEVASVIVEFKEEPLFIFHRKNNGFQKSSAFYDQRFAEFSSAVGAASLPKNSLSKSSIGISHQYYRAFFGVRISILSHKIGMITALPYVKAVHYDREVKATLEKSVPQVGADKVWETYGSQGEGIKVGIIDSGIDYMHPALGGGFGASFKVAGGYDFVNLDSDPMDDNGHGTHVAGIVSANSPELKGVAPNSVLYAYKVLNEEGNGLESDIISAVEQVVDPNGDGDMSDRLDVVNMSLGSDKGNPDDASSVAVNNASQLGVVFVIAAGNSGYRTPVEGKENNYYYNGSASIGSPGTAELAITVGAADSIDQRARFSSKGPNRGTFGIKPEVLAPGVNIHSTFLEETTNILNGTSMATPMVTGVVALLKSIHPDWNAERIKSAIVNTAKDIGLDAYQQGGGRVRALKATSSSSWIAPSVLNLGLDDPSTASWVRNDTLYIHNATNASQSYSTSVNGLQSGIGVSVSPSSFTIPSGDSTQLIVTTTVNNTTVAVVTDDIPLFSGRLSVYGTADTLSVPWAFARATRLTISFNEADPIFLGTNSEHVIYSWNQEYDWISPTSVDIYGYAKGTYDFYAQFSSVTKSKIAIKENVVLNGDAQTLNINSSEATIPLVFQGKDHEGNSLSSYPSVRKALVLGVPHWGENTVLMEQSSDTVMISPASDRYSFRPFEYHFTPVATKSFHIAQYPAFTGMSAPKVLTNNASDYIGQNFKFRYPPATQQAMLIGEFSSYFETDGQGFLMALGYDFDTMAVAEDELSLKGYFQRSPDPLRDAAIRFYSINDIASGIINMITYPAMVYNDSIIPLTKDYADLITVPRSPDGGTTTYGDSPPHLLTAWYNNWFGTSTLHFRTIFRGANRESRETDANGGTYSLYDIDGDLIFSNPLDDFPRSYKEFPPQWYKMVVTSSNFWLRNKKGKLTQTSTFDLSNTQASPPSLLSFMVMNSDERPANSFLYGSGGSLVFSAKVGDLASNKQVNPDSVKTWYRVHGTPSWIPLPVEVLAIAIEREGIVFQSDLSSALSVDSVAVDLKVFMQDSSGYTNEFQIEPAFAVGNWIGSDPTDVEEEPQSVIPKSFVLHQNFPNPFNPSTTIRFGLPKQGSVQVEIFNILGQRIGLLNQGVLPAGFHNVQWNADVPSGVYFYRVIINSSERNSKSVSQTKKMLLLR